MSDLSGLAAQHATDPLDRPREDASGIAQQRAVGRVVDVGLHDGGVDPQPPPTRDLLRDGDPHQLGVDLRDHLRAEHARDLEDRLGVRDLLGPEARKRPIDEIGSDFVLEGVETPAVQMLEDQHAEHGLGRRPRASAATAVRPAGVERRDDRLKHGLVLEQRVDAPQIRGPELLDPQRLTWSILHRKVATC
jgi:hypothetical protein